MEVDTRVMVDLKKQIEKGKLNFRKSPKERITEAYVATRLEALEVLIKLFTTKHEALISSYDEKTLNKSSYVTEDIFNNGYETYLDYKGELKQILSEFQASNQLTSSKANAKSNGESMLKLPKISIPTFSGAYSEWSSFRDLFVSLVHNNPTLDDVQRLHYLKTQVTGEAERLIKHLPITQSNYKICWNLLQNRYNNKRFMSSCILKRLFNQRTMNFESANAIKDLLDTTSDCLHEMSNLGIDITSWDVIIIYIVSLKLDAETRKQWELQVSNSCEELPSFQQFRDFLEARFRALEFVEPSKFKPKFPQNNTPATKVMHAVSNDVCPHCTEPHKLYHCKQFSNETVDKRRDLAKSLNVCFNCLGLNHGSKQCRTTTKCRVCQRKHHTLLHPSNRTNVVTADLAAETTYSDDNDPEELSNTQEVKTNQIQTHFSSGNVHTQTLLPTALVKAESKNGYPQVLRALLDQGSQASFISEAAVQILRLNKIATKSYISGLGGGTSDLTSKHMVMVNIKSLHDPTFTIQVKAHVLNAVTSVLPEEQFSLKDWAEVDHLTLADPQYNTPNKIDILLGSEVYCSILKEGLIKNPSCSMIAQDTYFGWVLSGQISSQGQHGRNLLSMHVQVDGVKILKQFWELETEPNLQKKILLTQEEAGKDHLARTASRDEQGQYVAELPLRSEDPLYKYGNSRNIAVESLFALEKRKMIGSTLQTNLCQVVLRCAPYLVVNSFQQTTVDEDNKYSLAMEKAKSHFNMDYLNTGCQTKQEAIKLLKYRNEMLLKGCFTLQEWSSNKVDLRQLKMDSGKDLEIEIDKKRLTWNRCTDDFDYSVTLPPQTIFAAPETKRKIITNRSAEILTLPQSSVQSIDNPANCALRGRASSRMLKNRLWKESLTWLKDVTIDCKESISNFTRTTLKANVIKTATHQRKGDLPWEEFSWLRKLVTMIAYWRRLLQLKIPPAKKRNPLPYLTDAIWLYGRVMDVHPGKTVLRVLLPCTTIIP